MGCIFFAAGVFEKEQSLLKPVWLSQVVAHSFPRGHLNGCSATTQGFMKPLKNENHSYGLLSNHVRGRPYMTSDDFCHFWTPPPLIRCFTSDPLLVKSDLAEPPLPPYNLTSYMDDPLE